MTAFAAAYIRFNINLRGTIHTILQLLKSALQNKLKPAANKGCQSNAFLRKETETKSFVEFSRLK